MTKIKTSTPSADIAKEIGNAVIALSSAKYGGFQLHVWPTANGVQANAKFKSDDGWTVVIRPTRERAILDLLKLRLNTLPF